MEYVKGNNLAAPPVLRMVESFLVQLGKAPTPGEIRITLLFNKQCLSRETMFFGDKHCLSVINSVYLSYWSNGAPYVSIEEPSLM